jgi:hypothetical protein
MKKLRLDAEALRVESFEPAGAHAARRGTVRGRGFTEEPGCTEYESCIGTCNTCYTYDYTCEAVQTCWNPTCDYGTNCPQTYGVTCPWECRTQGVIC